MRDADEKRRYKVRDRRADGKFFYDTSWEDAVQLAPDWFKTKAEAAEAWLKAQNVVKEPPQDAAEAPKRRGRPPKAEVETGIVDA